MGKIIVFMNLTLDGVMQPRATRRGSPWRLRVRRLGNTYADPDIGKAAEKAWQLLAHCCL